MTHLHARAAQLYIFQQKKPFNIPIDKAPRDKEDCCSSSQKRRVFLGQIFIVSVFVLIFQFQVRSAASGNGFTGRSILLAGSPAHLLDMFCRLGEQEKTSNSCYPLPLWLMGRSTNLTTSAEVQRGLSSHVWTLSNHLLTASAHQIAHCS